VSLLASQIYVKHFGSETSHNYCLIWQLEQGLSDEVLTQIHSTQLKDIFVAWSNISKLSELLTTMVTEGCLGYLFMT
jgi:hypothetical protein